MVNNNHHKVFIGVSSTAMLILGLTFGAFLTSNLHTVDMEIINIGLALTNIILLLLIGGLILSIRDSLQYIQSKKRSR